MMGRCCGRARGRSRRVFLCKWDAFKSPTGPWLGHFKSKANPFSSLLNWQKLVVDLSFFFTPLLLLRLIERETPSWTKVTRVHHLILFLCVSALLRCQEWLKRSICFFFLLSLSPTVQKYRNHIELNVVTVYWHINIDVYLERCLMKCLREDERGIFYLFRPTSFGCCVHFEMTVADERRKKKTRLSRIHACAQHARHSRDSHLMKTHDNEISRV